VVAVRGPEPELLRSWLQQCVLEEGCLFNGSMFICARHRDDDVDRALAGLDRAFSVLAEGTAVAERLRGPQLRPVFRTP